MENHRPAIQSSLEALGAETINLLRRHDLIHELTRLQLVERVIAELNPPGDLIKDALTNHCQQEQINNEKDLTTWLKDHCLSMEELIHRLTIPYKLIKLAMDGFGLQTESRFLQRKEELDKVTYSLLRIKDSNIAHELYLQLEANETTFENLARDYSEGDEKLSCGKIGPSSTMRAHPKLKQALRTATPGIVMEPILIEEWWVVVRLEARHEASFDSKMQQNMATELLEEWLSKETKEIVKYLCSREEEIAPAC